MPGAAWAGVCALAAVLGIGIGWAFQRGAPDFSVFYESWRLVLEGRGGEIYRSTPDRFLYAPGFAWILAPLGLLPRSAALAVWSLGKAFALVFALRVLGRRLGRARKLHWTVAGLAAAVLARPLLIDFQYGQVNVLILALSLLALLSLLEEDRAPGAAEGFLLWFSVGVAAVWKLMALPVLAVPWLLLLRGPRARARLVRASALGAALGFAVALAIPLVSQGFDGTVLLFTGWRGALYDRGFPLESHNQSFVALLNHYASGHATPVLALGHAVEIGWPLLSDRTIALLALGWSAFFLGLILFSLLAANSSGRSPVRRASVLLALLILPSHLIWKPYFVAGLALAACAVFAGLGELLAFGRRGRLCLLGAVFCLVNLTGFDVVGPLWGARFEAGATLLLAHLILLGQSAWPGPEREAGA